MAGTIDGGRAAAQTNKQRYGDDFYQKIGAKGGKNGNTGGFAARKACGKVDCAIGTAYRHTLAECAGAKGGSLSRRKGKAFYEGR